MKTYCAMLLGYNPATGERLESSVDTDALADRLYPYLVVLLVALALYFTIKGAVLIKKRPERYISKGKMEKLEFCNTKQKFITGIRVINIALGAVLLLSLFMKTWVVLLLLTVLLVARIVIRIRCL